MNPDIEENLRLAGLQLQQPPSSEGSYLSVNIRRDTAYVAIQFLIQNGKALYKG